MITYSQIGKKGNLGNQLFQIASTIGLAKVNNCDYGFFDWKYKKYFKNKLPSIDCSKYKRIVLEEQYYNYHHWSFENDEYDLIGWLQTEKYFDIELTKYYFQFTDNLINSVREKFNRAFLKKTILISIRRGDFVNHPDYFQLPIHYYLNSLIRFFPDWQSRNLIVLSDDLDYCKFHFSFLDNVFFGEKLNEIEQLCLGSMCDDFIISNSTFSWWSAWLGEKKDSKVIRPLKNFIGKKSLELDDKDYFPERWIRYYHLNDKIKLENILFCLKFKKNSTILQKYILSFFDVNIEINPSSATGYSKSYVFEKDYILPPILIYYSCLKIDEDETKVIINNSNRIFRVSRRLNYSEFLEQNDFGLFSKIFAFSDRYKRKLPFAIYLKNSFFKKRIAHFSSSDIIVIDCSVGKFVEIGGYRFSFNRCKRSIVIRIKRQIKKYFQ